MKLIFRYIRRHLGSFLAAVFFLCLETFAELLQPSFMARIVDDGVQNADTAAILRYGAIMLGIAGIGALGAVMRNLFSSRTSQQIGRELRSDLYRKVQTLSFENIDRLQPASIITRITNDVTQIQNFVNAAMRIMLRVPILFFGAVLLIYMQTPQQFPIILAIVAVAAVLIFCNMKIGYPRYGRLQMRLDRLNEVSREFLSSVRVVKAFGAQKQEQEKFDQAADDYARAGVAAARVQAVFAPLINLAVNFGIVLLLWRSQNIPAAEIGRPMASVNYMTQLLFALSTVSHLLNMSVRALASARRIQDVLQERPTQKLPYAPLAPKLRGAVRFEGVSFTYAGSANPALQEIDFSVEPGETLGIIGPTGSGKTTLVNLIPRFYDASKGRLLIDGIEINELDPDVLRSAVAIVPQKALLFSGTIAYNLRWGDFSADDQTIKAAAQDACADEFISRLPQGYETELGQGGVNLSGGQKQRLSIARALLRNPRILILDDCTSALDATTEAAVLASLRRRAAGCTVLIISQRISTVMRADRILCLENGEVRGLGSHAELMQNCPTYQAIYASQIGGETSAG